MFLEPTTIKNNNKNIPNKQKIKQELPSISTQWFFVVEFKSIRCERMSIMFGFWEPVDSFFIPTYNFT